MHCTKGVRDEQSQRDLALWSQHVGKMFLLLPSSGRNDFSSRSPLHLPLVHLSCNMLMLGGPGRRNKAGFGAEMGNVTVGKCQGLWQLLRQNSWLAAHAHTSEVTPNNKNWSLQLSLPLFVSNLGPKGHFWLCIQQKLSLKHLCAPRNWTPPSWERQRRRRSEKIQNECGVLREPALACVLRIPPCWV